MLLATAACLLVALLSVPPRSAGAQALETATKVSELHVFAEGIVRQARLRRAGRQRHRRRAQLHAFLFRFPIAPSFELRGSYAAKGPVVGQKVALGGVRADPAPCASRASTRMPTSWSAWARSTSRTRSRRATSSTSPTTPSCSTTVPASTYDLLLGLSLQGEFQYQHWNIGDAKSPGHAHPLSDQRGHPLPHPLQPPQPTDHKFCHPSPRAEDLLLPPAIRAVPHSSQHHRDEWVCQERS